MGGRTSNSLSLKRNSGDDGPLSISRLVVVILVSEVPLATSVSLVNHQLDNWRSAKNVPFREKMLKFDFVSMANFDCQSKVQGSHSSSGYLWLKQRSNPGRATLLSLIDGSETRQ